MTSETSGFDRRSRTLEGENAVGRAVRAPRGTEISCRGWNQEAVLRMFLNNLDPEVAERPEDLIVYGGNGKAARTWADVDLIVDTLRTLGDDETMLIQSGRPVAVMQTNRWAPRVLLSNAMIVPQWSTQEEFDRLDAAGLTMFGQMTAGSWAYIGSQGILQSTYETFAAVADKHFGSTLAGTLTLTSGLGGMGGAQPLAVTMNGGAVLVVEMDRAKLDRRVATGYLQRQASSLPDALDLVLGARERGEALSVGLEGNAAEILPEILALGVPIDIVTDQTAAHDPSYYLPAGLTLAEAAALRDADRTEYLSRVRRSVRDHVGAMLGFLDRGSIVFEYGNSIRAEARLGGLDRAFDFPGFIAAYIRPLFFEAKGHCRWIALSGDPEDIAVIDRAVLDAFPENRSLNRWLRLAHENVQYQGLPARTCMIGYGERATVGRIINDLVASGKVSAPVAIGREHLDSGSVASPYRETEAMLDGSDAIADWPILNAMVNVASGATWVSVHSGGGVGIGRSIHSGTVVVADGTPETQEKLDRVLSNDPGTGVMRYADAGYPEAQEFAAQHHLHL